MLKGHEVSVQILRIFLQEIIRNFGKSSAMEERVWKARFKVHLVQEARYLRSQL